MNPRTWLVAAQLIWYINPSASAGSWLSGRHDILSNMSLAQLVDDEDHHCGGQMKIHNPPHSGEILRDLCLEPLNLTVTEAARALGVSRKTLSEIVNGRAGISPEMAVRLSIVGRTAMSGTNPIRCSGSGPEEPTH